MDVFTRVSGIGNPGPYSLFLQDEDGNQIAEFKASFCTSNVAEYLAIVCGIKYLYSLNKSGVVKSKNINALKWIEEGCANTSVRSDSLARAEAWMDGTIWWEKISIGKYSIS